MKHKQKPLATRLKKQVLNEVTVTIMSNHDSLNYHETFLMDTSKDTEFKFDGGRYAIPAHETSHYSPSFWRFDTKLAIMFEQHKTLAMLFDWFNLRKRAVYEIGFLYWKETDPLVLKQPENIEPIYPDLAKFNYQIQHNTTIEAAHRDIDAKLKGSGMNMKPLAWMAVLAVAVVGVVIIYTMLTGGSGDGAPVVQNITATIRPR